MELASVSFPEMNSTRCPRPSGPLRVNNGDAMMPALSGFTLLGRKQLPFNIIERFELECIAGRVKEKHRCLLT